jgi:Fe-S cluster assembly iron-binding protein IscA
MLTITEGADEALTHLRANIDGLPADAGLRITTEPSDDGEPGFTLEVVPAPEGSDLVIEDHPLRVFVEAETAQELDQSALDGSVHGDHVHFGIVDVAGLDQLDDEESDDGESDAEDSGSESES